MKKTKMTAILVLALSLMICGTKVSGAAPMGKAFTYQGRLMDPNGVADGEYDFKFTLWKDPCGWTGMQLGPGIDANDVDVIDGYFTVVLDFNKPTTPIALTAFNGNARWLQIRIRPGDSNDSNDFVTLTPRQQVTPAPYALALPGLWTQQNDTCTNLVGGYFQNYIWPDVVGATIGGGGDSDYPHLITDSYCTIAGGLNCQAGDKAGTKMDSAYATVGGGRDNIAGEMFVTIGGGRGNEADSMYATVAGGYGNQAIGGSAAITISGGQYNTAAGSCATVGGGYGNETGDWYPTVGGGYNNQATGGYGTTVSGGYKNVASAGYATVSGGQENQAQQSHSSIGGGRNNSVDGPSTTIAGGENNYAGDTCTTIGGGYGNSIKGSYATIGGGGRSDPADADTGNRVTDDYGTISGGGRNQAGDDAGKTDDAKYATVGGGYWNTAGGNYATVGGGWKNTAGDWYATVAGGSGNQALGWCAAIPGGSSNRVESDYGFAAGRKARVQHEGSFIWADSTDADVYSSAADQFLVRASGGVVFTSRVGDMLRMEPNGTSPNLIGGHGNNSITGGVVGGTIGGGGGERSFNLVTDDFGTIGGGMSNQAGNNVGSTTDAHYATVSGGQGNSARGTAATVGGGFNNSVTNIYGTVGGGYQNLAGSHATISGGQSNSANAQFASIGGGLNNEAGTAAFVGGGENNTANGSHATVPGGRQNSAGGNYSFAAGRQAKADHTGAFVWGDSVSADVSSPRDNTFSVRASGGIWFGTTSAPFIPSDRFINTSSGAYLSTAGEWKNNSDVAKKENFEPVDALKVLKRLAAMPVSTWNYKCEDDGIRHLGPTAQDFAETFGLGETRKAIGTLDADGVAFAAIQGLYKLIKEKDAEIAALRKNNEKMEFRLAKMEAIMVRPVAVDKASIDIVQSGSGKTIPQLLGKDKLDPRYQVEHAERIGLGTTDY